MSCPRCCWARAASGFVVIFTGTAAEQCARDYQGARMAGSISPIAVSYVKVWRHAREPCWQARRAADRVPAMRETRRHRKGP